MTQEDAQPATGQPTIQAVAGAIMVPETVLQAEAINKHASCFYAVASILYFVIFLIAVVLAAFVQFVAFSVIVPGMFFWFVVAMIVSGVISTVNCCFCCCWGPNCASYKICMEITAILLFFIVAIWGIAVTSSLPFKFLAGTVDTSTLSDTDRKVYSDF